MEQKSSQASETVYPEEPRFFLRSLLPQATFIPGIITVFLSGIYLGLDQSGRVASLSTPHIAIGAAAVCFVVLALTQFHNRQEQDGTALPRNASLVHENRLLRNMAYRDGLTGLFNHFYFQKQLKESFEHAKTQRSDLCLLMLDLDHFKECNDRYGHPVGDMVLKNVSAIIQKNIRSSDSAARYGGDEFAVLLPGASVEQAMIVAERIRMDVLEKSDEPFTASGLRIDLQIGISIGIASLSMGNINDPAVLLHYADQALYRAKVHRNCVAFGHPA